MLFFIGLSPLAAGFFLSLHGHPLRGQLRTVWGKPDFGLCCCGQHPSWCDETSGLTHSQRLQGQSTDLLQITYVGCDSIYIRHKKAPRLRFSWGISVVLGILHLTSRAGSMSVSKQRALDDILSHWK